MVLLVDVIKSIIRRILRAIKTNVLRNCHERWFSLLNQKILVIRPGSIWISRITYKLTKLIMNKPTHRIIKWDCLEAMKKLPANSIDFICSDFPYNISGNGWLTKKNNEIVPADFWEWDKWEDNDDYLHWVFKVCKEYKRILKPNASLVLFFSYRYAGRIGYELERRWLFTMRTPIIFSKSNPQPQYKKTGFRSCYEIWIRLVNDEWKFNKPKTFNFLDQSLMKNVYYYKIWKEWGKQTGHPTEKPEFLTGLLVRIFSKKGDRILDSFGWGWTTGIASYKNGRNCISIEKEDWFCKMIQERQKKAENHWKPVAST